MNNVTCYLLDTRLRFVTGFIELLQFVSTSNYNALTNFRTLLLTTARAKFSVFTSRCLVMDPNNILFCLLHCRPSTISQFTTNSWPPLAVWPRHGPHKNIASNNSSVVRSRVRCCGNLFIEPLPSNGLFLLVPLFRLSGVEILKGRGDLKNMRCIGVLISNWILH
jgi:hypothetical protein